MNAEKKSGEESLIIKIKNEDGEVTLFKVKKVTRMSRVFRVYCSKRGVERDTVQFKFNRSKIFDEYKTIEEFGIKDNDIIECYDKDFAEEIEMRIKIKNEDGEVTTCVARMDSWMSDVFRDYCSENGIERDKVQFKFNGAKVPSSGEYKTLEQFGIVDNDIIECSEATIAIKVVAENGEERVYNEVKKSTQMSEILNGKNGGIEMCVISSAGYSNHSPDYAQAKGKGIEDVNSMQFVDGRALVDRTKTIGELARYPWIDRLNIHCYLPENNARHHIEELLSTETSPGFYSTGSQITGVPTPSVEILELPQSQNDSGVVLGLKKLSFRKKKQKRKKLSFPLDDKGVEDIKNNATRAGVGMPDRTVVNLDVRTTWQIKPENLRVSNVDPALEIALQMISQDFGLDGDYKIEASLYKLLLYEPGCFFLRHRDNERLDNMFATLVLELPSEYEGAELSVYSPLTPTEKTSYAFNGGHTKPKRKTRANAPGLHFAAFYADCYHEVSKLTSGHRVALIYHLTATANPSNQRSIYCGVSKQWMREAGKHLPAISPSPPQPVDEVVAIRLSKLVHLFASESDADYPSPGESQLGKPKKLVVVLSHHYTPASLTCIHALKGSDRSIAELICAAAFRSPDEMPSLARIAAKEVVKVGGEEYATNPRYAQVNDLVSEEFKVEEHEGPFFDAAICLANVWDHGELTESFRTTGPLISLTGENLNLGPKLPDDRQAHWHPSYFGGQDREGIPFMYEGPVDDDDGSPLYDFDGPVIFGEQVALYNNDEEPGNHSLPIFSHELLLTSEEARASYRKGYDDDGCYGDEKNVTVKNNPKEIEFLGNGMPYMGRVYSRAVILIWPRAHRRDVQTQSKGGRALLAA